MAPHSSTVAWKIPWMEEPGGLQTMGSLRVGHDWATSLSLFTFMHWRRKWQPTPVFLPGESHGRRSLVGCSPWGCTESDMIEATQQQQHTVFSAPFVYPFSIVYSWYLCWLIDHVFMDWFLAPVFCSIGLFVFLTVWYCFNYYGFKLYFQIKNVMLPVLFFFLKIVPDVHSLLWFHINFRLVFLFL